MPELVLSALALVVAVLIVLVVRSAVVRVTVFEYQRALKFANGRLAAVLGPGRYWIYRPSTVVMRIEMREQVVPIAGQEVITADGFSIKVSLAARQKVVDPVVAVTKVEDYRAAVYSAV